MHHTDRQKTVLGWDPSAKKAPRPSDRDAVMKDYREWLRRHGKPGGGVARQTLAEQGMPAPRERALPALILKP